VTDGNEQEKAADEQAQAPAAPAEPLPTDIAEALEDAIVEATVAGDTIDLSVKPAAVAEVCRYLRDREGAPYEHLASLAGVDYGEELGVTYHLYQMGQPARAIVRVRLPREGAALPTVSDVFPAANWKEREASELFGITFEGHPDPRKLLLPEDWEGYPLRKDYVYPDHPYLRPDPLHELDEATG
jgi:NADH-quinone oxidoreductase subunit C